MSPDKTNNKKAPALRLVCWTLPTKKLEPLWLYMGTHLLCRIHRYQWVSLISMKSILYIYNTDYILYTELDLYIHTGIYIDLCTCTYICRCTSMRHNKYAPIYNHTRIINQPQKITHQAKRHYIKCNAYDTSSRALYETQRVLDLHSPLY